MSPSFNDGLPVSYPSSYNGVKDTRPNCSTQSTGGSTETSNLESYYMPSPSTQGTHLSPQSQSQQSSNNNSSSSLLAAAINPSIATYSNPQQHLHSASSSQSMLATPPSTTYEGEDLDHYSYHGSPASGGQPLAPSSAHPSAPSPRGWSPLDSQPMGFQQQFLRSPEPMLTYNFRNCPPAAPAAIQHEHQQQQMHSQVSSSSPFQSHQDFAPTSTNNMDVDTMAHHEQLPPVIAVLRDSEQSGTTSHAQSPQLKREGSENGNLRNPSRAGHHQQQPQQQQNSEEGGKVDEPYAQLIHRAFMSRDRHAMTLQEIYQWFRENTEKGKSENKGWQNSIRHNLSMNRAFSKRELKPIPGEPLTGLRGSKKLSEWYLMPWAINGVQSTTRYRTKGTSRRRPGGGGGGGGPPGCPNSSRRAMSGRKGGLTASKSKATKKASQARDNHHHHHHHHHQHASFASGSGSETMQHHQMVLDPGISFSYSLPDPMTPPEQHGPADIMMQHTAATLPVGSGGAHGLAYPAPELPQSYAQGGGQYHQPHNMYALDDVAGMYQGQPVTVPSNGGGQAQGQQSQHAMGAITPIYEESEEMRQRRLAFHYQGWNESGSYQQ